MFFQYHSQNWHPKNFAKPEGCGYFCSKELGYCSLNRGILKPQTKIGMDVLL